MIRVTYKSDKSGPDYPVRRYVGPAAGGGYRWCDQSAEDPRYDLRQGTCDREDLPPHIAKACDEYKGAFYACEWPPELCDHGDFAWGECPECQPPTGGEEGGDRG